jgi:ABC-type lipoprotein export system ATPase subunit
MNESTDEILVRGTGVSKRYVCGAGQVLAVKDAAFVVNRGARIAVVGPSGSGKTTLLHLMSGIDAPSGGAIEWPALGDPADLRPQHVAVCFQSPSLLPALSVAENVAFPLLLAGRGELSAASAALAVLDRMGLAELADRLPEEVSGGQSQRLALARALVSRPALLLADEPTGQQDHGHGERLIDVLLELARDGGIAVVVATHDPAVAARFQTKWTMRDGFLNTGET